MTHNARKRCIKKNFDGIHDRFQRDPVYRDSQLKIGWTEEKCIAMDKLTQEDHSYFPSSEEYESYQKNWYISLNKSGKNAPMRLSEKHLQTCTVSTVNLEKSDLNQSLFITTKGGIRLLLLPALHGGTGIKTGGAHFFNFVVAGSFTAGGNQLQPTGGVNSTSHTSPFSRMCNNLSHDIGSSVHARHPIHVSRA